MVTQIKQPAFRFAYLGSGSKGNAALIQSNGTCVMLDCGFSARETASRLTRLDIEGKQITAIVLTHEHSDHISGAGVVARHYQIPIWTTAGTYRVIKQRMGDVPQVNIFDPHKDFEINDLMLQPFPVPHDAREPAQFVFTNGHHRLGILTDTGCSTPHIEAILSGCDALVMECNHDLDMLMNGSYPESLKLRVSGNQGHLDNDTASELVSKLETSNLQHIVAAHLSEKNNESCLAKEALSDAVECTPEWVAIADQETGLSWREIS